MGKSTVLGFFEEAGLPTWDADAAVARLYAPNMPGTAAIGEICPEAVTDNGVDRQKLSAAIAQDRDLLGRIEAAIHPFVAQDREAFAASVSGWGAVYDVPLLFETGQGEAYDCIVVVSASPEIQTERVMARPGMTAEKLALIRSRQMPDAQKRAQADHVIDTSVPIDQTRAAVLDLADRLKKERLNA